MIEIVFSESACGGLKQAQHFGEGEYRPGGFGTVFCDTDDGEGPTPEEILEYEKNLEKEARLAWEQAIPMGGNTWDVFGFDLGLSIGDISDNNLICNREKALNKFLEDFYEDISDLTSKWLKDFDTVCQRASAGEDIRIWYSNQPDEMCGLYWIMAELEHLEGQLGTVYIVKLPEHKYGDNNTIIFPTGWGETCLEEWHRLANLAEATTYAFRQYYAQQWKVLQEENAVLRIVLNGQLVSAPETIYDYYIHEKLKQQNNEFQEGRLIGHMFEYQFAICDMWYHYRIKKMIDNGELTVVDQLEDDRIYSRILKK